MRWMLPCFALAAMLCHGQSRPVLVELFTSEGCSSCPPADALLERLDHDQPVAGVDIIVLSEHVDYWNHDGWTDPFSSAALTARQEAYCRRLAPQGPYTPQMIIDGTAQFVGSDAVQARNAIQAAARAPKIPIRIEHAGSELDIRIDPLPAGSSGKADVLLALAANSAASDVLRGENQGHRLTHVAVLKQLKTLGKLTVREGLEKRVSAPAPDTRLIVIVQDSNSGQVRGAAAAH